MTRELPGMALLVARYGEEARVIEVLVRERELREIWKRAREAAEKARQS